MYLTSRMPYLVIPICKLDNKTAIRATVGSLVVDVVYRQRTTLSWMQSTVSARSIYDDTYTRAVDSLRTGGSYPRTLSKSSSLS